MSVVKGKNVVLSIGGDVVACARAVTLTTSTSFVETTTVGSGKGATFKPKKNNTVVNLEGVVFLNETGKYTLPHLRKRQLNHTLIQDVTILRTDETGNTYTDTFDMYLSSVSDTGTAGDFASFTIDGQVDGDPVITVVCDGMSEVENMAIAIATSFPFSYTVTWDWVAPYSFGDYTFYFSFDDGDTWEEIVVDGVNNILTNATTTPSLTYKLGIYTLEDLEHILRIKITCPYYTDTYVDYELLYEP